MTIGEKIAGTLEAFTIANNRMMTGDRTAEKARDEAKRTLAKEIDEVLSLVHG